MSKSRSKRWTEADAREVLARIERSGASDTEMARKLGVDRQRIQWWRNRLRKPTRGRQAKPGFVEVEMVQRAEHYPFEVYTSGARMVAVWPGFDADELKRLLAVVESEPC